MKKTFLAILMILVLATAGLFAVTNPGTVTATLKATLGEYLMHGFNYNSVKYQPTVTIEDAFGTTAPSFKYGFKTNAPGHIEFKMAVGNFINQTVAGTVKIASITSSRGYVNPSAPLSGGYYTIFDLTTATTERVDETIITVYPAKTSDGTTTLDHASTVIAANEFAGDPGASTPTGAPAGVYVSEIVFSIIVGS